MPDEDTAWEVCAAAGVAVLLAFGVLAIARFCCKARMPCRQQAVVSRFLGVVHFRIFHETAFTNPSK